MKRKRLSIVAASIWTSPALADWQLNLPKPETEVAQRIYDLHTLILLICLVIFVAVFGAMFYALFKHRKSVGHEAHPFHENTLVEIVWTVIPLLILAGMAWPATKTILDQRDTRDPDLTIKITGYQWKWQYDYMEDGVKFMSVLSTPQDEIDNKTPKDPNYLREVDEPMVVPVGKKVRLLLTSNDVIHSWWVPELGVKQDAIPGFIRDTWFRAERPGAYRGQCAELCGRGHAFMPIVVEAKPQAEYAAWLAGKKGKLEVLAAAATKPHSADELKANGEKVYTANCASCHQANGQGIPGAFPALVGSKVVNGDKAGHITTVLDGRPGTAMPAFGPQLSDLDIASVLSYERTAWGNHAEIVQPDDVKALRK
jgi:cytochrome c oxidase subunit 2